MHICRKWRHIVFASHRALHLRLFCTHRKPVLKTLDSWPALPIVVQYGGFPALDPPAPEDDDNIMTALVQSDRVVSVHLTITTSLLEKLYSIEEPFSRLEDLVLLSLDDMQLSLPSTFLWGPHLRTLHLTRIAFPTLSWLLSSSRDLVDIQLHEISSIGYISPESLRDALSGMTQLRSLSLRFHSLHSISVADYLGLYPPSGKRVNLPTLTYLKYHGTSEFLDSLVARIDAPHLGNIEITLSSEYTFNVSNLAEFIDRLEMPKSYRRAHILFSERSVSISLTHPTPTYLKLQVLCKPLSQQLFFITRFSSLLSCVEDLHIEAARVSCKLGGSGRWTELIHSLRATKRLHLAGDFSTDIAHVLQVSKSQHETVLPALRKLYISQPGPRCAPLRTAVASLMVSHRLSGHIIEVEYERLRINGPREIGKAYAQCQYHN
jgi:hypothetical protein